MTALLKLDGVSLTLDGQAQLRDINLTLNPGERLAVIGPSGAGKSTLARLVSGLCDAPVQGHVQLDGMAIRTSSSANLAPLRGRIIARVSQGLADNLNPQMTVLAHIIESLQVHTGQSYSTCQPLACAALLRGNVPESLHTRRPRMLSGGETQRVLIVLAMLHHPKLLVLDEPTAALDVHAKSEVVKRLARLPKATTVLLVTHDLSLVQTIADRVAVMDRGRIIEHGAMSDLFTAPQHRVTQRLLRRATGNELVSQPLQQTQDRPILRARNLGFRIEGRHVFQHVSLDLAPGDTRVIQGDSGVGKTTLARLIAGWQAVQCGQITSNQGAETSANGPTVALISQHPYAACAPHLSIASIIAEPLRLQTSMTPRERAARVNELLASVQLPHDRQFTQRRPDTLSGGELQRVVIARALALAPQVLIADEPTSALDTHTRNAVLEMLTTLQQRDQFALLVFTHDPDVARLLGTQAATLTPTGLRM